MAANNSIKRTVGLKRNYQLQRRSKPKPISDKHRLINKKYAVIRDKFMQQEENQFCQIQFPGCTIYAQAPHHPEGRDGEHLTDVNSFIPACNWCNQYADDHPEEARAKGVSKLKHTQTGHKTT